ncbi:MAG: hypothetical protein WBD22_01395 [Pyrinomonadaceae bacterium]
MKKIILALIFPILVAFYSASAQTAEVDGRVFWHGTVDDKVQLVIRGVTVETRTVSGKKNPDGNYSFTAKLPTSPVTISAAIKDGRGKVTVLQQPSAENDFSAIVEISDEKGKDDDYLIDIFWRTVN